MTRPILLATVTLSALLAALAAATSAHADWTWPLQGDVITPFRNGDDPYASGQHRGIDIAGDVGSPVVAAAPGEVRFAGAAGSSGLTVGVRTEDGRFDTSYLHLSSIAVREGQRVAAGELVGAVGTSGARSAERPHLHFGVRDAGSRHAYRDPLAFLQPSPVAPERPRGAPSPSPVPAPLTPSPAPVPIEAPAGRRVPEPRRSPQPRGAPRRRPIPAPRRSPEPHRAPRPRPTPVPRGAPRPQPTPVPQGAPRLRPTPAPRGAPRPQPAPTPQGAPGPQPAPTRHAPPAPDGVPEPHGAPQSQPAPKRHAPPARHPAPTPHAATATGRAVEERAGPGAAAADGRPDIGWALACFGLLVAAGVLGLSEDGRRATVRSSRRFSGFLRPRLGRR